MQISRIPRHPLGQVPVAGHDDFLGQVPLPSPQRPAPPCAPAPNPDPLPNDSWAPRGHELFDGSGTPIFGG
jgi:hypothetical protein